jgi:phage gpG-like protein
MINLKLEGGERVEALLLALQRRSGNLLPLYNGPIDKSVTMLFRAQFSSNGAYGGQPWAPLRPSTREWRVRSGGNRGGVGHPLWDTGEGKASFETVGPNSYRVVGPLTYERGSTLPRMALHQKGYTIRQWGGHVFRNPRRVPARPIVPDPVPTFLTNTWLTLLERYLEAAAVG